jgi:hypothetical protein
MGVMGLLQDLHPHTDLGATTSFTLLQDLMLITGLSSSLVVMDESLILLYCVLIINLILIY